MSNFSLRPLPVPDARPPVQSLPNQRTPVGGRALPSRPGPVQGTLPLMPGRSTRHQGFADDFGPVPTGRADLPDPKEFSRGLVQVLVEVMAGLRPCTQLLRWTTTSTFEQVRLLTLPSERPGGRLSTPPQRRPVVRSIHVCEPADGVAEVSAVIAGPTRTQAMALRCEGQDGRWRLTVLETG